MLRGSTWQPTPTLVRAALTASGFAVVAVAFGRPELLVLATPFLVHTLAAVVRRPRAVPVPTSGITPQALREGEGARLRVQLASAGDVEHAVLASGGGRFDAARPASGIVSAAPGPDRERVDLQLALASVRWGRRPLGGGVVGAISPWSGFEWGPMPVPAHLVTTLPVPGPFDSRAATPHPIGLVGMHPSRRRGDGSEFESIRPFHPGDRLRRLHWRVSLRTGTLHVTSTVSEEDASLLLLVDAGVEVGVSGGIHGAASTLDVAVRAAGAVAEHALIRGDRVGLRVLGTTRVDALSASTGRRHLRRVLETLARVVPGLDDEVDAGRLRYRASAGTTVLVFSPMLTRASVAATTALAARGLDVIVVDCLPPGLEVGSDDRDRLGWRMRLLERRTLLEQVARSGIPVVPWHGPGTLDEVLRRLGRRTSRAVVTR